MKASSVIAILHLWLWTEPVSGKIYEGLEDLQSPHSKPEPHVCSNKWHQRVKVGSHQDMTCYMNTLAEIVLCNHFLYIYILTSQEQRWINMVYPFVVQFSPSKVSWRLFFCKVEDMSYLHNHQLIVNTSSTFPSTNHLRN